MISPQQQKLLRAGWKTWEHGLVFPSFILLAYVMVRDAVPLTHATALLWLIVNAFLVGRALFKFGRVEVAFQRARTELQAVGCMLAWCVYAYFWGGMRGGMATFWLALAWGGTVANFTLCRSYVKSRPRP
jgi:hypothetical protein